MTNETIQITYTLELKTEILKTYVQNIFAFNID